MCFVDNYRVVTIEGGVCLGFHEKNPVGHDSYVVAPAASIIETDLVSHRISHFLSQFFRDAP